MQAWNLPGEVTVNSQQFTRAIRKIALSALLCCFAAIFAHEMALPSYIYTGSFSCKHGICLHKRTSELLYKKTDDKLR